MSETYVRKQEVVDVECITVELFDRLYAQDPGFVKHASIGDYLVSRGLGTAARILTPGQLAEEYEKQGDGPSLAQELAPKLQDLSDRIAKLAERVRLLEAELLNRVAPKPIAPEETKPETPRAKGKQ